MNELIIRLNSVRDVEDFVAKATGCPYPIFLDDGQHTVSGKSFMEMFCLVLTRPLRLVAQCDDESFRQLRQNLDRFLVL